MERFNVLFIPPIYSPVPSVKGGAMATLVTDIADVNEHQHRMNMTIISWFDEAAVEESKKYRYTKFHFVCGDREQEKKYRNSHIVSFINKIGFKVSGQRIIGSSYVRKIKRILAKQKFDFVFVAGGEPSDYGSITRMVGRKKMIFNVGGQLSGGKVVANTFEFFFCCSQFIANALSGTKWISQERIKVLLNRVDTKLFMQKITEEEEKFIRNNLGLKIEDIVILFMGRISSEKGIKELLEAFIRMKNRTKCKLLIVGKQGFGNGITTQYELELKELAKNLEDSIVFTGFIHHNKLWKIMKVADFGVFPSTWEEPAGNVVPEAMATGLPLIITRSGGMVEYVTEKTAIIVEKDETLVSALTDRMDYLCKNQVMRDEMGRNAQEKSKEFDRAIYYSELMKVFTEIQKVK